MKVLVYNQMADDYRRMLAERFPDVDVVVAPDEDGLHRLLPEADVLLAWRFRVESLRHARRLRWVQLTSAGVEHVLRAPEYVPGIVVTNARGIHAEVMADFALGVVVMLQWDFPRLLRNQQARLWRHQFTEPLAGKTLGVVGVGAIGAEIARRGVAFGMEVLGVRRHPDPVDGVRRMFAPDRLPEMLAQCDFVVLVVPATPGTERMIAERELRAMKPTAYLVNIARGAVVDEPALVRALRERWIAGAALDVFAAEPLAADSPLWAMENVIVTPHIAGEPEPYARRVMDVFGDNLVRWREGRPLRNLVDLARGY